MALVVTEARYDARAATLQLVGFDKGGQDGGEVYYGTTLRIQHGRMTMKLASRRETWGVVTDHAWL